MTAGYELGEWQVLTWRRAPLELHTILSPFTAATRGSTPVRDAKTFRHALLVAFLGYCGSTPPIINQSTHD